MCIYGKIFFKASAGLTKQNDRKHDKCPVFNVYHNSSMLVEELRQNECCAV